MEQALDLLQWPAMVATVVAAWLVASYLGLAAAGAILAATTGAFAEITAIGDAWLTCELTTPEPDPGLAGRWCVAVATAAAS